MVFLDRSAVPEHIGPLLRRSGPSDDSRQYYRVGRELGRTVADGMQIGDDADAGIEARLSALDDVFVTGADDSCVLAWLHVVGELEKVIDQLEPLLRIPYFLSPGWLRIDPNVDTLRKNPRFQKLVAAWR